MLRTVASLVDQATSGPNSQESGKIEATSIHETRQIPVGSTSRNASAGLGVELIVPSLRAHPA
jgi:hypothetical protein